MALTNSLKGGEEVGLLDDTLFLIPYLWNQWVLSNDRAFFLSSNGVVGLLGGLLLSAFILFIEAGLKRIP